MVSVLKGLKDFRKVKEVCNNKDEKSAFMYACLLNKQVILKVGCHIYC